VWLLLDFLSWLVDVVWYGVEAVRGPAERRRRRERMR
jgi:hypothetical protein